MTIQKRMLLKFSVAGSLLLGAFSVTPAWAESASGLAESTVPSEAPSEVPTPGGVKPAAPAPAASGPTTIDLAQSASTSNTVSKNDFVLNGTTPRPNQGVMIVIHKVGGRGAPLGSEVTLAQSDASGHFTLKGHLGEGAGNYRVDVGFKDPVLQNSFPTAQTFNVASADAVNDPPAPVYGAPPAPAVSHLVLKTNAPVTAFAQNAVLSMTRDPSSPEAFFGLAQDWKTHTLNIMHSDDGGETWKTVGQQPDSGLLLDRLTVGKRQADGSQDIFLSTPKGVFRSSDRGKTLTLFDGAGGKKASDVKLSEDGQHLVIGYQQGGVEIFSRDSTGKWTASPTLSAGAPTGVTAVQVDPMDPRIVYAGSGPLLYRWDGQKWSNFRLPGTGAYRDDHNVVSIEVDRNSGKLVETTCQGAYVAQVDNPQTKSAKASVQITKIRSNAIIDHRPFLDDYPYAPRPNPNYNRPNPNYLRAFDAKVNPANANQTVIVGASGIYFQNKGQVTRINTATALDSAVTQNAAPKGTKAEYRSVVWSSDGKYFIVSGETGTFKFKVSGSSVTLTGDAGNLTVGLADSPTLSRSRKSAQTGG